MQKVFVAAATLVALSASALALAQTVPSTRPADPVMTAADLKSSLFGIRMTGYANAPVKWTWDECIEPGGNTRYVTQNGELQGRLTISPKGLACFAYADDGFRTPECFVTRRSKDGFVFSSEFGGPDFIVTKVVRGIRTCEKQDLIG